VRVYFLTPPGLPYYVSFSAFQSIYFEGSIKKLELESRGIIFEIYLLKEGDVSGSIV